MSFDLYVFALPDLPSDPAALMALLDDEVEELDPAIAPFVADLGARWPGDSDEEFDASPWSSWPLSQPVAGGLGCAFNVRWSVADQMFLDLKALCAQAGFVLYDPQAEVVHRPGT
jgi:hypothetical protein